MNFISMNGRYLTRRSRSRLATAENILIASHVRPDGDAVGSLLGIGIGPTERGQESANGPGRRPFFSFRHLEGSDQIKTRIEEPFDTFITVDCADFKRTGKPFESLVSRISISIITSPTKNLAS